MIFFSVKLIFPLPQIANTNTSENLIQLDDPRITHLLATTYVCSKQFNLRQFSLTRVRKCSQALSEIESTKTCASFFLFVLKQRELKALAVLQLFEKHGVFCAQGEHIKWCRHVHMDWHSNFLLLLKELDPIECKRSSETLLDCIVLNSINIHKLVISPLFFKFGFRFHCEKKQTPFTVIKLNTARTCEFIYQAKIYD